MAIALWVAHAHLVEFFETSPILAITSAQMRSGKTRLLDCLELLVPHPFRAVMPSEAVTYTVLAQRPRPTLLLDEADAIFGPRTADRHEGLRAILNSGNRKGTPVPRVRIDGPSRTVEVFDVFGPKAIAAIGDLPATVADRSIPIRLKRRSGSQPVEKFRTRTAHVDTARFVMDWGAVTLVTDVPVPDELGDRAADSWEALIAIAEAAGGPWPGRARRAAIALHAEPEEVVPTDIRLLGDVREAFEGTDHLATEALLGRLHQLEGAPWSDWYGAPLTAKALSGLLANFGVHPTQRRLRGVKARGYFRSDLEHAFRRHLPDRETGTPGTAEATSGAGP